MSEQTNWRVGDFAERLQDHALVRKGEVHVVTKMYRGGYLGFAGRVGGEWNPNGWRKVEKGSVAHEIEMSVVRTTLRNAIIPPATSCGTDCDCTAECERDFSPAHLEAQPETDGGGEVLWGCADGNGVDERLVYRDKSRADGAALSLGLTVVPLYARDTPEGQTEGAVTEAASALIAMIERYERVDAPAEDRRLIKRASKAYAALASKGV